MTENRLNLDPNAINEPIPTQEEADHAGEGGFLVPPGDYLVRVDEVVGDVRQEAKKARPIVTLHFTIQQPSEWKGKKLRLTLGLWFEQEEKVSRDKRWAVLVTSGLVKKGDAQGLARFDWRTLPGRLFVYRVGQAEYWSKKRLKVEIGNEPQEFASLYPAALWEDAENCMPAPQEWAVRPYTGQMGGENAEAASGAVPVDV